MSPSTVTPRQSSGWAGRSCGPTSLVPTPQIKTTANFDLPVRLEPAVPGANPGVDPRVTVTWGEVTDPSTLNVAFNGDLQSFAGFADLGFDSIVLGLRGVQTFLGGLEDLPGLDTPIPGVGSSFWLWRS